MRSRHRWLFRALIWTLAVLAVGLVVVVEGLATLAAADQACFFNYPATACPGLDDPAIARITFAFFGLPLVWLVGLGVIAAARARERRGPPRRR